MREMSAVSDALMCNGVRNLGKNKGNSHSLSSIRICDATKRQCRALASHARSQCCGCAGIPAVLTLHPPVAPLFTTDFIYLTPQGDRHSHTSIRHTTVLCCALTARSTTTTTTMSVLDYYSVLGIAPDASSSEIRRAYKEQCMRVHPDRLPEGPRRTAATQLFQQVSDAYQVLSDSNARAAHDAELRSRYSNPTAAHSFSSVSENSSPFEDPEYRRQFASKFEEKVRADGGASFFENEEELFSAMFGQARSNFKFETREKAPDREIALPLTLEELHTGCTKRRKLQRTVRDQATGELKPTTTVMRIDIQAGYRPGDRIRFRGAGSESEEMLAPDVVFVIEQKDHTRFVRTADDLHMQLQIPLSDSLAGINTLVTGIDGEQISVVTEAVAKPNECLTISGKGMARRGKAEERGDLVLHFQVIFPDRLTPVEKRVVRDVIGKIEARSNRPQMRRTASMFSARVREVSDVDGEPRSTGRHAFRGSSSPDRPTGMKSHSMRGREERSSMKKESTASRKESTARKMSESLSSRSTANRQNNSSPKRTKGFLGLFR